MIRSVDSRSLLFPKLRRLKVSGTRFEPRLLLDVIRERTVESKDSGFFPLERVEIDYFALQPLARSTSPRYHRTQAQLGQKYTSALEAGLVESGIRQSWPSFKLVHDPRYVRCTSEHTSKGLTRAFKCSDIQIGPLEKRLQDPFAFATSAWEEW